MDREKILEKAEQWLIENCPTRLIKQYDSSRLTDFALSLFQWKDINSADDLPDGYGLYSVAWFNNVEFNTCAAIFSDGKWWDDGMAFPYEVVAWMPIPEYKSKEQK